jgi:alpha-1,3-rhamnosyltransferase
MKDAADMGLRRVTEASVSVVDPSFNHARFVEKCLRSIFSQTLAPLELLVIDDGSNDGSPQIIEHTLEDCAFPCELIVRANLGLSATLNEGLKHSRGKYFAYLGSDDLWFPEFLQSRVELLESRYQAVLAYGNAYSIDEQNRIIDCTTDWAAYVDGDAQQMLLSTLAPLSPTVLYRRNVLEDVGWNENSRLEDYELYLQLSVRGEFAFDRRVLSAWRQHPSNTSLDLKMMMDEKLATQRRVAPEMGLSPEHLKNFQALAKFRSAQEFMREGQKLMALRMAGVNWTAIPSMREAVRMLAGLLTPTPVLQWNKARKRREAGQRYGSVAI